MYISSIFFYFVVLSCRGMCNLKKEKHKKRVYCCCFQLYNRFNNKLRWSLFDSTPSWILETREQSPDIKQRKTVPKQRPPELIIKSSWSTRNHYSWFWSMESTSFCVNKGNLPNTRTHIHNSTTSFYRFERTNRPKQISNHIACKCGKNKFTNTHKPRRIGTWKQLNVRLPTYNGQNALVIKLQLLIYYMDFLFSVGWNGSTYTHCKRMKLIKWNIFIIL